MGVIAKGIPKGCQGLFTPVALGYPLSVFNYNSMLKQGGGWCRPQHARLKPRGARSAIPLSIHFDVGDPKCDCTR